MFGRRLPNWTDIIRVDSFIDSSTVSVEFVRRMLSVDTRLCQKTSSSTSIIRVIYVVRSSSKVS